MPHQVSSVKCPVCAASHAPVSGQLKNGVYAGNCQNCGFFFKFRAVEDTADSVTFTVNGTSYTVGNEFHPATSLNEWLRCQEISTGTKHKCLEGGCGLCIVAVTLYEPISAANQVYAVNSCLLQLYMCDGMDITTIEGLGSVQGGLHAIQQRMVQYNASQCGFCSPGQVMNMYGLLKKNPTPTKQQVEDNFDATICRCTGYRPILDAMKSFAVDAPASLPGGAIDIEDDVSVHWQAIYTRPHHLGMIPDQALKAYAQSLCASKVLKCMQDLNPKLCKTSGKPCAGQCGSQKSGSHCKGDKTEKEKRPVPLHIVGDRAQWFKPTTLEALCALLKQYRDANYRLVFGNSGYGVYRELGPWMYDVLIDIRGVRAMYGIDFDPVIVLGANLSLNNLLDLFVRVGTDPSTKAYFPDFAAHMKQVASNVIRNAACWAGNLMLKHKHPDFISDVYTMFATVGAKLLIVDEDQNESQVTLDNFMAMDMKGKVITAVALPTYNTDDIYIRTFRVAQRLQLCHGYVLAGFNFQLDKNDNFLVKTRPTMVFQGINATTNRATRTETYLTGKRLGDPQVLQTALTTLGQEIKPANVPVLASPQYRQSLACALFYKYVLGVCSTKANVTYRSGGVNLTRPVSSGVQNYTSNKQLWPLNEPMTKMVAGYQVSGESVFLDDVLLAKKEVYASFVLSTKGNARVASMDPTNALALDGVYKFIQASDIPSGGKNNFYPPSVKPHPEELLCSGQVLYAGQPLAIVVANDQQIANTAAAMVNVTYSNVQKPVTDLREAIQVKSFFPVALDPTTVGSPDQALAQSAHRITGTIQMGTQDHFSLESQISRCAPNDDGGMNVQSTTQWIDATAEVISNILNIPQSSVTVEVKRLGGAFGSKITRNFMVSGACALAAHIMERPVRLHMDISSNMKAVGKRYPYYAEYEIGSTAEGKLNAIKITVYADCGCSYNDNYLGGMFYFMDNAYNCPNWQMTTVAVKTNKAANTFCRSPGSTPAQFMMESMMEHLAKSLNKDPDDVRKLNFYQKGQVTPFGYHLDYFNLGSMVSQLETSCDLATRKQQVALFNQTNRWKKRGLSMVPTKFGIDWKYGRFSVFVAIYHADGTIAIEHGGIEVGQGINTKTAQVCAYELGVPMSLIRVKKGSSVSNANSVTTGGSITSELNAKGVIECCKILKSNMDPVRQTMKNPTWKDLVTACYNKGVDLTAHYYVNPSQANHFEYFVYAAAVTEVEVDILTGQSQIIRADMLYDGGQSMNQELDIGQIEGGFVMGLGYHLTEKEKFDPVTGEVLTASTWEYKPPMPKDIPIDFRITLMNNVQNPLGVLRSKATGEPPVMMSASALFAIKHAVEAARADIGQDTFFTLNSPALVEDIQTACLISLSQLTYGQ